MSVVPLVVGGDHPTVVDTPEGFERAGGLQGTTVLIRDMDPEQLVGASSNISYDLRVGREYRDHRDVEKRTLHEDGRIIINPGTAVILETEESVQLPRTRFACIVPKVSLLQKGLSNTMSKIDPGYQGNLLVTLFNLGKETVSLRHHESCCSLCVFQVEGKARPYEKQAKRIESHVTARWWPVARWWPAVRDFLERNTGSLTAVLILVTILSVVVQLIVAAFVELFVERGGS